MLTSNEQKFRSTLQSEAYLYITVHINLHFKITWLKTGRGSE